MFVEIYNQNEDDYIIEISEDELGELLQDEILEYSECDSLRCLLGRYDIEDVLCNLKITGSYEFDKCEYTTIVIIL